MNSPPLKPNTRNLTVRRAETVLVLTMGPILFNRMQRTFVDTL